MKRKLCVGIIGAGFAAELHANAYRTVGSVDVEIAGVAASSYASAERFAREFSIDRAYGSAQELIEQPDIDMIDLCVPNRLHEPLALFAAEQGKHIVCEKPLTGYFGGEGAVDPVGDTPRSQMLAEALSSGQRILDSARQHNVRVMYAENWVYSPAIDKINRLVAAGDGTILEIRGAECHSGSHSVFAKSWEHSGGGALIRLGSHPIGAALWLKAEEGERQGGGPIFPVAVTASVGDLTKSAAYRRRPSGYIVDDWQDVENWSVVAIEFSDGSRAVIQASDIVLGGIEDTLSVLMADGRIDCDMSHAGAVRAYAPTDAQFGDEYIMEKISTKAGWSYPSIDESYMLGYPQEIADFCESVVEGREPRSTGDLGLSVVKVIYASYLSAEQGRRVSLEAS